jgi:hypothetical protein
MSYDFSTSYSRKARIQHICEGCRGPIRVGEPYRRDVGKYEGDFFAVKMHHDCRMLWGDLWSETDKMPGDNMGPYIPDELDELPDGHPLIERYNKIALAHGGHLFDLPNAEDQPAP